MRTGSPYLPLSTPHLRQPKNNSPVQTSWRGLIREPHIKAAINKLPYSSKVYVDQALTALPGSAEKEGLGELKPTRV